MLQTYRLQIIAYTGILHAALRRENGSELHFIVR